jgi:hypothetical protein
MTLLGGKGLLRGSRWLRVPVILLLALATRPAPGLAWGDRGHKLINAAAVENLPEPLRSYFRARKAYLVEHALDPDLLAHDDPAERPHHYTDLDADDAFPFLNLRRQFVLERAAPKPWQLPHGDSIWQIERFTLRLADSLQHRRWQEAEELQVSRDTLRRLASHGELKTVRISRRVLVPVSEIARIVEGSIGKYAGQKAREGK